MHQSCTHSSSDSQGWNLYLLHLDFALPLQWSYQRQTSGFLFIQANTMKIHKQLDSDWRNQGISAKEHQLHGLFPTTIVSLCQQCWSSFPLQKSAPIGTPRSQDVMISRALHSRAWGCWTARSSRSVPWPHLPQMSPWATVSVASLLTTVSAGSQQQRFNSYNSPNAIP